MRRALILRIGRSSPRGAEDLLPDGRLPVFIRRNPPAQRPGHQGEMHSSLPFCTCVHASLPRTSSLRSFFGCRRDVASGSLIDSRDTYRDDPMQLTAPPSYAMKHSLVSEHDGFTTRVNCMRRPSSLGNAQLSRDLEQWHANRYERSRAWARTSLDRGIAAVTRRM